jgi:hypothetical protein
VNTPARRGYWVPGVYREARKADDAADIARELLSAIMYRGRVALLIFANRQYTISTAGTHACASMIERAPEALVGVYNDGAKFDDVLDDIRERQQVIEDEATE